MVSREVPGIRLVLFGAATAPAEALSGADDLDAVSLWKGGSSQLQDGPRGSAES